MRTPGRHRPKRKALTTPPAGIDLASVADRVQYVGSPEHKDTPSFAGWPRPRADATICDKGFFGRQKEITNMLRKAIRQGLTGSYDGEFPRYVWARMDDDVVYEARLINQDQGQYKGYQLEPDEWPEGI